jgi:hypothetical protein
VSTCRVLEVAEIHSGGSSSSCTRTAIRGPRSAPPYRLLSGAWFCRFGWRRLGHQLTGDLGDERPSRAAAGVKVKKIKAPLTRTGLEENSYRISTSTPGRGSGRLISTPGSLIRRRSSIVTSGSRTPLPTVTSGVRVQFSPHSGPTQFRSHTSAALAGSERRAEPVIAAAKATTELFASKNLHDFSCL